VVDVRSISLLLTLFILVFFVFLPIVYADRGGFSPISERVSESGQKAIIAWNGTHEILILSTDVSSSNESEVVELMPGNTEISLFTIMNNELNDASIHRMGFVKKAQFQIKQETLAEIHTNLTKLFSGNPYLYYFRFKGSLESFDGDISADFQSALNISTMTIASLSLCLGLALLFLFMNKIGFHLKNVHIPMTGKLEITSLFVGLAGISLTLSGFFLPLGLVEFGKNGELLITISGAYVTYFTASTIIAFSFLLLLLATIYFYVYRLLRGNSKGASLILVIGGAYMLSQALISSAYLYTVGVGLYTILIGCSSIISAGLLSLRHIKLTPTGIASTSRETTFKTYIANRLLTFIATLIGISLIIFWLWYISPFGLWY